MADIITLEITDRGRAAFIKQRSTGNLSLTNKEAVSLNRSLATDNIHIGAYTRFLEISLRSFTHVNTKIFWEKGLIEDTGENDNRGRLLIAWTDRGRRLLELKNWYAFLAWDESDKLTQYREIIDVNKILDYQKESAKIFSDFNDSMKHDKIIGYRPTTEIHNHFHEQVTSSQFSQGNNAPTTQSYNETAKKSKWDKLLTQANLIKLLLPLIVGALAFFGVRNWNDIKKLIPERRQEYKQGNTTKSHI